MHKKTGGIVLLFGLSLILTLSSRAQMRQVFVDNQNANNEINKLSFYSPSQGYVGFTQWVGYTVDSGRSFVQKPITLSNVDYNNYSVNLTFGFGIAGVKAFNQDSVIVYGDYGLVPAILYSTDGCNTFKLIFQSQYNPLQLSGGITDMVFPQNDNIGYAVDADRILKTTDRGFTWAATSIEPGSFFTFLESVDDNNVFAMSTNSTTSKILKTTNGGAGWQTMALPAGLVEYASFFTASKGWLNMDDPFGNGSIYYTSNGGTSWVQKNDLTVTPFSCDKMKFVNDSTGYALSGLFTVWRTTDSGRVWEPIPRDNSFSYLGFSHNDLQLYGPGPSQLWAGGGHGFLEINTNPGGPTLPEAFFRIDTANLSITNTVNLLNYSRPVYSYQWFKDRALIGTGFNASYTHNIFQLRDTIELVVSNGVQTDTSIQYQNFYPPTVVAAFLPTVGGAGTVVTIKGSHFTGAVAVSFGGVAAAAFTVVSDSVISATVGAGASGNVVVSTPTGRGSLVGFVFLPPPTITSFIPTSAIAGTTITITGTNLTGASSVRFGGEEASSFTVVSSTTITAIPGPGLSGAITVTTPGGIDSLAGFTLLPFTSAFSPSSGTNGTVLTITGKGLADVTGIRVGGIPVRSFVINSPTTITALVGPGGTGSVVVTTAAGSSSLAGFTYFSPPVISSFSPISAPVGATVTILGSNFSSVPGQNIVYFGAVQASVSAASTSTLTVTVPAGATFQPVTVTTNRLTAYSDRPFALTFPNGGSITPHSFAPTSDFPSGTAPSSPYSVAVGDLDGDGKPDMAVANLSSFSISVLRNTGSVGAVSFAPKTDYPAIDEANNIFMADIDGDGKLDLIVTNSGSSTISIFRNVSVAGGAVISFAPRVDLPASVNAGSVTVADVDGDGKPDLIVTDYPNSVLAVLINNGETGNVSFAPAVEMPASGGNSLTVTDIDGDGKPDLVMIHITGNFLSIARNTSTVGNPSFVASVNLTTPFPYGLFACDIDGDGKPDLVCPNPNGNTVTVFRNTSVGGTISFAPKADYFSGNSPVNVSMGDLDGDGRPDLIVANASDTSVSVFKNTSVPGQISFGAKIDFMTGVYPQCIAIDDMDGDGKNDMVVANQGSSSVSVLRNTVVPEPFVQSFTPTLGIAGTVVTITGANFTGATGVSFGGIAAASFIVNASTSITAVVGTGAAGDVMVTNSFGGGALSGFVFGQPPVIAAFSPALGPVGTKVTITGSGFSPVMDSDIVYFGGARASVSSASGNSLVVLVPAGTTYDRVTVTVRALTGYSAAPFVVTFPGAGSTISPYAFSPAATLLGGNVGCVSDLDGDGKLDLAFLSGTSAISVARNTSVGRKISFDTAISLAVGPGPLRIGIGDLDGDGRPDIVVCNTFISVLQNTSSPGSISFAPHVDYVTGPSTTGSEGVVIGDLDGDGKPDIAIVNYFVQTLSIFRNITTNGQIAFAPRVDIPLSGYPTGISIGDLDGDGKPDLALSVNSSEAAAIFRNTSIPGAISFAPEIDLATGGNWPNDVRVGDMNGDGKPDISIVLINSNEVVLFSNMSSPGNISFSAPAVYATGSGPHALAIGDLDGDGRPDLAVENSYFSYTDPNSFSIFKNSSTPGNASLAPRVNYITGPPGGTAETWWSAIGDMDGDGKADLVVFADGAPITVWRNQMNEPYISGFTPAVAYTGETVTITGSKLSSATAVSFGGVAAQSFTVLSDSSISAVVGEGASDTVMVIVPGDTIAAAGFTYIPIPTITPRTATSFCQGGEVVLDASSSTGNQWYRDGIAIAGAVSDNLLVATGGAYTVTTSFDGVTTPASPALTVTVNPIPPKPIITMNVVDSLVSSIFSGNQWYMDTTTLIPGATGREYIPVSSGYYSVKVTQNGCPSPFSDRFNYLATAVVNLGGPNNFITFSPNPAADLVRVSFALPGINELDITISDLNGKRLMTKTNILSGDAIDISSLAKGLYFITAYSRDRKVTLTQGVIRL